MGANADRFELAGTRDSVTTGGAQGTGNAADAAGSGGRGTAWILVATCLGLFAGVVDTTAVNLALPSMRHSLGGNVAGMQWTVDAYNLAFAALLLTGGTLGDRFGRKRMFLIGVSGFLAGSVMCALAPNLPVMIAGRAVQGAGSAVLLPQSLAILAVAFPGRRERNRAMAIWSTVSALGLAAGPTIGGVIVSLLGWQYIFWMNVPVCAVTLWLAVRHAPASSDPAARRLDLTGQVLAVCVLAALAYGVIEGGDRGWASPAIFAAFAVVLACLGAFILVEHRVKEPMLPLELLRSGQLPVAAVAAASMTFGMYGLFILFSLDFQQQRGLSAMAAGLELLPMPAVFAVVSPLVGRLATRIGPKIPMATGLFLMGAGLFGYATLGGGAGLPGLEAVFVMIGLGLALNTGPVVAVAVTAVPPDRAGLAGGVANLARMLGATLGVAVMGSVLAGVSGGASHGPRFLSGLTAALIVGGIIEMLGALVAVLKVRNPRSVPS